MPLDALHVVDLGVMKKLMSLLLSSISADNRSVLSKTFKVLSEYCPSEFQRKPRSLDELAFYKGKEFRTILLYTGAVVFRKFFSKDQYSHVLSLHVAYRILNDDDLLTLKH